MTLEIIKYLSNNNKKIQTLQFILLICEIILSQNSHTKWYRHICLRDFSGLALQCWECSSDIDRTCSDRFNLTDYRYGYNPYGPAGYNQPQFFDPYNQRPAAPPYDNRYVIVYNVSSACDSSVLHINHAIIALVWCLCDDFIIDKVHSKVWNCLVFRSTMA